MILGINHVTLAVSDLEISFAFYQEILGFRPVAKWDKAAYMEHNGIWLALSHDANRIPPGVADYSHIAFTCSAQNFSLLREKIGDYGCQEWSINKSEGDSFYFLDPDGHQLEIHVGDLQTRLEAMKQSFRDRIQYFDTKS